MLLWCLAINNALAQNKFTIEGSIGDIKNGNIWLTRFYANHYSTDTANIVNGKFKFEGTLDRPVRARLDVEDGKADFLDFCFEPGKIKVKGNDYPLKNWVVIGSKVEKEDKVLEKYLAKIDFVIDSLLLAEKNTNKTDSFTLKLIEQQIDKGYEAREELQKQFIIDYPNFVRSLMLVEKFFVVAGRETDFKKYFNALSIENRNSSFGKILQKDIIEQKKQPMPEIKQKDTSGNWVSLRSLKGKYVFVDFWASWCNPCRAQSPELLEVYNNYKSNNLVFLSISLDVNAEDWRSAIVADSLNWVHLSELNGWQNSAAKAYNVTAVPTNFLIDAEGKRIAKDLRPSELEQELKLIFNK